MRKVTNVVCLLAICASAFILTGCDQAVPVMAPEIEAQFGAGGGPAGGGPSAREWRRVDATADPDTDEASFTTTGGYLEVNNNWLIVPMFAVVGQPVTFTMSVTGHFMDVELSARRGDTNVGSTGFRKPVTLCLYYPASNGDRSNVRIAQFTETSEGTKFLPVTTTYTPDHVCGELKHFSGYTMVED
ncbi:MAG TPA: hypothetical protein VMN60_04855 [Longimicrobiales bacterium]|nr:hypothetical protein [Longimicrobiales bacterium]